MKRERVKTCVILPDIRSSYNVGSIFRTADALGIEKIFLTGYTPAPKDQFGRVNKEIAKVALGAENSIPWETSRTLSAVLKKLKKEKYEIVAIEQSENSTDYKKFKSTRPTAFVIGNEVDGLSDKDLKQCDRIVEIPMRGRKESLNVSVAFGIALARILNL